MKKLTKAALLASAVVAAGAFMGCSSDVDSKDTTVETFKAKEIENLKITNVDNRALVIKWDVTESVGALDLYKKVGDDNWTFVESDVESPKVILPTFAEQFAGNTEYKFKLVNNNVTENPVSTGMGNSEHYVYKTESVAKEIAYKFDLKKDEVIPAYKTNLPAFADTEVVLWTNENKTSYEISIPKSDVYGAKYEVYAAGTDALLVAGVAAAAGSANAVNNYNWNNLGVTIPFITTDVDVKVYKTFGNSFYEQSPAVVKNIKFDNTNATSNLPAAVTDTNVTSVIKDKKPAAKITWSSNNAQDTEYVIYKSVVNYEDKVLGSFAVVAPATEVTYGTTNSYVALDTDVKANTRYMYIVVAKNKYGVPNTAAAPKSVVIREAITAGDVTNFKVLADRNKKNDDPSKGPINKVVINDNCFYLTWEGDTAAKYALVAKYNDKDDNVVKTDDLTSLIKNDGVDHFSAYTTLSALESEGIVSYTFVLTATDEDGKKTQYTATGNATVDNPKVATLTGASLTGVDDDVEANDDGNYKKITKLCVTGSNLKGKTVKYVARFADGSYVSDTADCKDLSTPSTTTWEIKTSISGSEIQSVVVQYEETEVSVAL